MYGTLYSMDFALHTPRVTATKVITLFVIFFAIGHSAACAMVRDAAYQGMTVGEYLMTR